MAKATDKIQDFGDTVAGSKKALWRTRGFVAEDLIDMEEKEILSSVKKQVVWKEPDYIAMFNEGCYREDLYFLKLCYNAIGATIPVYVQQSVKESAEAYVTFLNSISSFLLAHVRQHTLMFEQSLLKYLCENGYLDNSRGRWSYTKKASKNPAFGKTMETFLNHCLRGLIPRSCNYENLRAAFPRAQGDTTDCLEVRAGILLSTTQSRLNIFQDCYTSGFPLNYNHNLIGISSYTITHKDDGKKYYYVYNGSKTNRIHIEYPAYVEGDESTYDNKRYSMLLVDGTISRDIESMLNKKKEVQQERKAALMERAGTKDIPKEVTRIELPNQYVERKAPRLRKGDAQITSLLYEEGKPANVACFNFRGGEFGNWQNKRQECLNCAVDAFSDLAYVTDLPFSAMSVCFTGERSHRLTIAWGSRGSGRASAHYEPNTTVINLTKYRGAGTLAHEWGHALDHALGRWCKRNTVQKITKDVHDSYITCMYKNPQYGTEENKLIVLFNELMSLIKRKERPITDAEREQRKTNAIRYAKTDIESRINVVVNKLLRKMKPENADKDSEWLRQKAKEVIACTLQLDDFIKVVTERGYKVGISDVDSTVIKTGQDTLLNPEKIEIPDTIIDRSDYYRDAMYFDSARSKPYYATSVELFARAFESFVEDVLKEQKMYSEYLVYGTATTVYEEIYEGHTIYPKGDERKQINEKIREILKFVCDNVVKQHFDSRYAIYYKQVQAVADKYFVSDSADETTEIMTETVTEQKKEALATEIGVANENLKFAKSMVEVSRTTNASANTLAESVQQINDASAELAALNNELPEVITKIKCIVTSYNDKTQLVSIRSEGDMRTSRMNVSLVQSLLMANLIEIVRGMENLPADIVALKVPVMT